MSPTILASHPTPLELDWTVDHRLTDPTPRRRAPVRFDRECDVLELGDRVADLFVRVTQETAA